MTESRPFAAAIRVLGCDLADMEACGRPPYGCLNHTLRINEFRAAIRVLEAAGALTDADKAWLASRVDRYIAEYALRLDGMNCPGREMKDRFNALVLSLPDKPGKEK